MQPEEADQVAELIYESTNHWYETSGYSASFKGGWQVCRLFTDVYEDLDPGCCLIAVSGQDTIIGSCFYHPRKTHISLGIMNTHPAIGRRGVAKALLTEVIQIARKLDVPLRLVSSAFNLDSYSLYTRQGLVPFSLYQDLMLPVPKAGIPVSRVEGITVRDARLGDLENIDALEYSIWRTSRQKDWRYFIENSRKIWHVSVAENQDGEIVGSLASVSHPCSNMLGPGIAKSADLTTCLIQAELNQHKGKSPVFLVPAHNKQLVSSMYDLGARNCELHVGQILGNVPPISGVVMPTFMPETA